METSEPFILVLEGGGAKGSYTCGVLHALDKLGIRFSAAAGTSAGALNAIAISTHQIYQARDAWRALTFWKLLSLSGDGWRSRIGQGLFCIFVGVPCFFLNLLGSSFSHRSVFLQARKAPVRILSVLLLVCAAVPTFLMTWPLTPVVKPLVPELIGIAFGGLQLHQEYRASRIGTSTGRVMLVFILFVAGVLSPFLEDAYSFVLYAIVAIVMIAVGVFLIEVPSRVVAIIGKRHLTKVLEDFLKQTPDVPCVVTLSALAPSLDPTKSLFEPDPRHAMDSLPRTGYNLRPHFEHVPVYRDISRLKKRKAVELVLASTALPLGISKAVRVFGMSFEDGGMGDNCPLLPFLLRNEIGKVIVVMLSPIPVGPPDKGLGTKQGQAIAKQQVKALVLEALERRLRRATYREFRRRERIPRGSDMISQGAAPFVELERLKSVTKDIDKRGDAVREAVTKRFDLTEMIVVAPEEGLGSLLTGTLAFWPSRIDALFRQGEADGAMIFRLLSQEAT